MGKLGSREVQRGAVEVITEIGKMVKIFLCILVMLGGCLVVAEDPYQYEEWTASYIDASPLGVTQKVSGSLHLLTSAFYSWEWIYLTFGVYCWSATEWQLQVIAINGQFPGPQLETTTNYNLVISVRNELDEPFLITWWVPDSTIILISLILLYIPCLLTLICGLTFFASLETWLRVYLLHWAD